MTTASILTKLSGLNWIGGALRLWLVLTACWEAFVLFHIFTGHNESILLLLFAMLWPVLFLAVAVATVKAVVWVLLGFKGRDEKIDGLIQKIDDAMTAKNMLIFSKRMGVAVLEKSGRLALLLVSICALGLIVMLVDLAAFTVTNVSAVNASDAGYKIVQDSGQPESGIYTVQAPDGKKYTLQGPENASESEALVQVKNLYKNKPQRRYQISLPAGVLFSIGVMMLFRRILTGGSNTVLFRIAVAYLSVVALDVALVHFSLNPFYPDINLQIIFFIGLLGFIVLNPLKKMMDARAEAS